MNGANLFVLAIAASLVAIAVVRLYQHRQLARHHPRMELAEIHQQFGSAVSMATLKEVFEAIGTAYSMDPRVMRPTDNLKALFDVDSFGLDAGTAKMNAWLLERGIDEKSKSPQTVLDLLMLVEERRQMQIGACLPLRS